MEGRITAICPATGFERMAHLIRGSDVCSLPLIAWLPIHRLISGLKRLHHQKSDNYHIHSEACGGASKRLQTADFQRLAAQYYAGVDLRVTLF